MVGVTKQVILAFGMVMGLGHASAAMDDDPAGLGPCYAWTEPVVYQADKFMPVREAGVQYNFEIGVIFYDNQKDIAYDLMRTWLELGMEVTPKMEQAAFKTLAFTRWEHVPGQDTMRCVVTLPKLETVDGEQMCSWGHELAHCVLGQHYHMTRVITDSVQD